MSRGKDTCRILKEIRRQIAEANDIAYVTSECRYRGDCLGTCPRCEAEVRYLEQQLERRRLSGRAVTLLGISAGVLTMGALPTAATAQTTSTTVETATETIFRPDTLRGADASFTLHGTVVDEQGNPLIHASILEKNTDRGTLTDTDGRFTLLVSGRRPLVVSYIGMETREVTPVPSPNTLCIVMQADRMLMGEMPVEPASPAPPADTLPARDSIPADDTTLPGVLETMPEFADGGQPALMEYIRKNLRYPEADTVREGRIVVQFTVDEEGNVSNAKIVRNPGLPEAYEQEALRLVNSMPRWKKPGTLRWEPVKERYTIPINFRRPDSDNLKQIHH